MDRCRECGFDYDSTSARATPAVFSSFTGELIELLTAYEDRVVRVRPDVATWSALEYVCHVRDLLLVQRERILLALVEDTPTFTPMYRDRRAENARYQSEAVEDVTEELRMSSNLLIRLLEGLSDEQLSRTCIYIYPEPMDRDLEWVFRHAAHEVVHHEMDVRRVIQAQLMHGEAGSFSQGSGPEL